MLSKRDSLVGENRQESEQVIFQNYSLSNFPTRIDVSSILKCVGFTYNSLVVEYFSTRIMQFEFILFQQNWNIYFVADQKQKKLFGLSFIILHF